MIGSKLVPALVSTLAVSALTLACQPPDETGDELEAQALRVADLGGAIATVGAGGAVVATPVVPVAPPVGKEMQRLHPWVVTIGGTGGLSCHGVLIHPSWVLTAAHCIGTIAGQVSLSRTDPVTGVVSQQTRPFDVAGTKRGMFVHPGFVRDSGFGQPRNDIALIRLGSPFTIDSNAQTAALPRGPSNPGRTGALAVSSHTTPLPAGFDALVRAPVLAANECATPPGFLCVRPPASSLCAGDSGSGFLMNLDGRATVVGIASNITGGADCLAAGGEAQMTDVYLYRDWILSTMGKSLEQVAGQVRVRWSGYASPGTMSLLCMRTGSPLASVSMDVPGGEIGVDCDPKYAVRVFCQPQGDGMTLAGFSDRTIAPDGSVSVAPWPFLSSFTVALADPSSSFQQFTCSVSKLGALVAPGGVLAQTATR